MRQSDLFKQPKRPWNAGRLIGLKAPLKPKHTSASRWATLWRCQNKSTCVTHGRSRKRARPSSPKGRERSVSGPSTEGPLPAAAAMSALGARATLRMPFPRVLRCIECAKPRLATNYPRFVLRLEHARLIQAPKRDFDLIAIDRDDT